MLVNHKEMPDATILSESILYSVTTIEINTQHMNEMQSLLIYLNGNGNENDILGEIVNTFFFIMCQEPWKFNTIGVPLSTSLLGMEPVSFRNDYKTSLVTV